MDCLSTNPSLIAIDFDDTFTVDPTLWSEFITAAQRRGHKVVCITWRRKSFEMVRELESALPKGVDIHSAYGMPKREYAKINNLEVDIWIDDMPEAITECN